MHRFYDSCNQHRGLLHGDYFHHTIKDTRTVAEPMQSATIFYYICMFTPK